MNVRHDMVTVFVARPGESGCSHEFLQLCRAGKRYMTGTWQIIRGGVKPGEAYLHAALREMHEESGLEPVEFYRLGSVESFYIPVDDAIWHSAPFCAIVDRSQSVRLNDEHDDFRWIARERIEAETMWGDERRLLRDLMQDILDGGPGKPFLRIDLAGLT